jgi:hypothetical protein
MLNACMLKCRLLALVIAHFATAVCYPTKMFITLAPVASVIKRFTALNYDFS